MSSSDSTPGTPARALIDDALQRLGTARLSLDGPSVQVDASSHQVYVVYLGTAEALLAAGCLTRSMMANREMYRPGDARGLRDEHRGRFNLHRLPTRAMSERIPQGFPKPVEDHPRRSEAVQANTGLRPSFLRLVVDNTRREDNHDA